MARTEGETMSDTPRTDAAIAAVTALYGYPNTPHTIQALCIMLERELTAMMAERDKYRDAVSGWERENSNEALLKECAELRYALRYIAAQSSALHMADMARATLERLPEKP
jgi:hypothetical protein